MANFQQALQNTFKNEGGYINDPDDSGGETYKGISRSNNSKWGGWVFIDMVRNNKNFPHILDSDVQLQASVSSFYESNYWDRVKGDDILNQDVANSIFDFAVNAGVFTSSALAQLVVGTKPDGIIGGESIDAINKYDKDLFLAEFTIAKIARYINIVKKKPTSRKYFYGWVIRSLGE